MKPILKKVVLNYLRIKIKTKNGMQYVKSILKYNSLSYKYNHS